MGIVSEETPGLHSPRQSPATPSPWPLIDSALAAVRFLL